MYEYKTISIPQRLTCKNGLDLGHTLADYIETTINATSKQGWEYYCSDNYTIGEMPGCLGSIFGGGKIQYEHFNVLVFRKEKV